MKKSIKKILNRLLASALCVFMLMSTMAVGVESGELFESGELREERGEFGDYAGPSGYDETSVDGNTDEPDPQPSLDNLDEEGGPAGLGDLIHGSHEDEDCPNVEQYGYCEDSECGYCENNAECRIQNAELDESTEPSDNSTADETGSSELESSSHTDCTEQCEDDCNCDLANNYELCIMNYEFVITGFSPLADEVANQTVPFGTELNELTLPETLEATIINCLCGLDEDGNNDEDNECTCDLANNYELRITNYELDVTWHSSPEYTGFAGEFIFTATLPDGYTLADGVTPPQIIVEVGPLGFMQSALEIREDVPYIDADGNELYAETATVVPVNGDLTNGWWVVENTAGQDNFTRGRITISGDDVNLILADNTHLMASIHLAGANGLTIWAQSTGGNMGSLTATAEAEFHAGIGGNNVQDGGSITIIGGNIIANGGSRAAGIGGGGQNHQSISAGSGGNITISGGDITATGQGHAAGIGGGGNSHGAGGGGEGGSITISGGTVNATASDGHGAGIGGGIRRPGGTIIISGGTVVASNVNNNGTGIGGGYNATGGTITITGGDVTAIGGGGAAGIGGRGRAGGTITITDGTVNATGGNDGAGIGGGSNGAGGDITISGGDITATGQGNAAGIGGGSNGAGGDITISGGDITATGHGNAAGIGGAGNGAGGNITISGGDITATGHGNAAGIGGAGNGAGGNIFIYGEETRVTATRGASGGDRTDIGGGGQGGGAGNVLVALPAGQLTSSRDSGANIGSTVTFTANPEADYGTVRAVFPTLNRTIDLITGFTDKKEMSIIMTLPNSLFMLEGYTSVRKTADELGAAHENVTVPFVKPFGGIAGPVDIGEIESGDVGTDGRWLFSEDNILTIVHGEVTVTGKVDNGRRINVLGDATLRIQDLSITVTSGNFSPIAVVGGTTLTLYVEGENSLSAHNTGNRGNNRAAGINVPQGNTLIIRGDGILSSESGYRSAGIGGSDGQNSGSITIESGDITATGIRYGAGIGGGRYGHGGNITISGGTVTAFADHSAAGIGGGHNGHGGNILIYGEETRVTATGGTNALDIGRGSGNVADGSVLVALPLGNLQRRAGSSDMNIGNTVTFTAESGSTDMVEADLPAPFNQTIDLVDGLATDRQMSVITTLGDSVITFTLYDHWNVYRAANTLTNNSTIEFFKPTAFDGVVNIANIEAHHFSTDNSWTFDGTVLTINDGAELTITGTVSNGRSIEIAEGAKVSLTLNDLSITGFQYPTRQSAFLLNDSADVTLNIMGSNTLNSGYDHAGIQAPDGTTLLIDGEGSLTAVGRTGGAGIGGGPMQDGGHITIAGGTITANGNHAAGIGGGGLGSGGNITITGGTVVATAGGNGAGIGGGGTSSEAGVNGGGNITISGGTVTATGGYDSAGIGGGSSRIRVGRDWVIGIGGEGGNITISGGTVTANRNPDAGNALGIGRGHSNTNQHGTLNITGNAVVFVPIGGAAGGSRTNSILFTGNNGTFHGTNITPTGSFTMQVEHTLTIPSNATLNINSGVTVTNKGTLTNNGTIGGAGSITNNGTINCTTGNIGATITADTNRANLTATIIFPTNFEAIFGTTLSSLVLTGQGTLPTGFEFEWVYPNNYVGEISPLARQHPMKVVPIGDWVADNYNALPRQYVDVEVLADKKIDLSDDDPPLRGLGWTFDPDSGIYTISDNADVVIVGKNDDGERRIVLGDGKTARITLDNASIGRLDADQSPIAFGNQASVTLTLIGDTTVTAGDDAAAIDIGSGLAMEIDGDGSLEIVGGNTLTIPNNVALAIGEDATLINRGTLTNHGTIGGAGSIANHGTINCTTGNIAATIAADTNRANLTGIIFPADIGATAGSTLGGVLLTGQGTAPTGFTFEWVYPDHDVGEVYPPANSHLMKLVAPLDWANADNYNDLPQQNVYVRVADNIIDLSNNNPLQVGIGWTFNPQTQVYTILDEADVVITGSNEGSARRVAVASSAVAKVTLYNASIEGLAANDQHAMQLFGNANVTLTLVGENTLSTSGGSAAGIAIANITTLTIGGDGSLEAVGGNNGAGIGGFSSAVSGTVIINSGTITAQGNGNGAGIGGGSDGGRGGNNNGGNGGTITINGGTVIAQGSGSGAGIGGGGGTGNNGTGGGGGIITITGGSVTAIGGAENDNDIGHGVGFSPPDVSGSFSMRACADADTKGGLVFASSVFFDDETYRTHGILVTEDATYWYGGDNFTLRSSATVPNGKTLTIGDGKTLTIYENTTLTNMGSMVNHGTISGTGSIANNGTINCSTGNIAATITTGTNRANLTGIAFPTEIAATHGNTLGDTPIPSNGTTPLGTFAWSNQAADVGEVGTQPHEMTIDYGNWANAANYNLAPFTQNVNILVIRNIAAAAITGITAPVTGETSSTGINGGTGFTAQLGWESPLGAEHTRDFLPNRQYYAKITLTAEEYHVFPAIFGDTSGIAGFSVDGAAAPVFVSRSNETLVFTVQFLVTDRLQGAAVNAPTAYGTQTASSITVEAGFTGGNNPGGQAIEFAASTENVPPINDADWHAADENGRHKFTGLDEYTEYYFFARAKQNDTHATGGVSGDTSIRTADESEPTGTITVRTRNIFQTFINWITFGLFFQDEVTVTIASADAHSGVEAVQYLLSETALTEDYVRSSDDWQTYYPTSNIGIDENRAVFVYARITDNAGNYIIINADGIVVFTESHAAETSIGRQLFSGDLAVSIDFNGNTVRSIMLDSDRLEQGADFTIGDDEITFTGAYLDSLGAGEAQLVIHWNPFGITEAQTDLPHPPYGDTISTTTIAVTNNLADRAAPNTPTMAGRTAASITLNEIIGAQFRLGTNGAWQGSPVFEGLSPNTSYDFYAWFPETATHNASPVSARATFTTDKADRTAPDAPTMAGRTATSITLNEIDGAQFRLGTNGEWQGSPVFEGLSPNTSYDFYAWFPETVTHHASPVSAGATFSTDKAALRGTVTIDGDAVYGETLTANISKLTTNPPNHVGSSFTYQWLRNGTPIDDATSYAYTLVQADIGRTIRVVVTAGAASNAAGYVKSDPTAAVAKAQGPANPPTIQGSRTGDGTTFTFTITPIAGAEYRMGSGEWQSDNVFTGIIPLTTHTFYARIAETATHLAGAEDSYTVQFDMLSKDAPSQFTMIYRFDDTVGQFTVEIPFVAGAEYSFDGTNFSQIRTTTAAPSETVNGYARYPQTLTHNQSDATQSVLELPALVESVTITGEGNSTSITTNGGTLQMSADVMPENATQGVIWSITQGAQGAGNATISADGLLTAIGNGTVTVRATAIDGTGIFGEMQVTISGQSHPHTVTDTPDTWRGSGDASWRIVGSQPDRFIRLLLDGSVIDEANFARTQGSTIITLSESFIKTLPNGPHTFRAEFINGYALLALTVENPAAEDDGGGVGDGGVGDGGGAGDGGVGDGGDSDNNDGDGGDNDGVGDSNDGGTDTDGDNDGGGDTETTPPPAGGIPPAEGNVVAAETTVPRTGDGRNPTAWLMLLIGAAAVIGSATLFIKRRKA